MPASAPKPAPEPVWVWKIGRRVMLKIPAWNDLTLSVLYTVINAFIAAEMTLNAATRHRWHWIWITGVVAASFNFLIGAASIWAIKRQRRAAGQA
jgi:hypothetical protein